MGRHDPLETIEQHSVYVTKHTGPPCVDFSGEHCNDVGVVDLKSNFDP